MFIYHLEISLLKYQTYYHHSSIYIRLIEGVKSETEVEAY